MSDLEVFTFDIKTDMQKLESDIKNEITGQAADIKIHSRMVACGVVGQVTAEVHHMSYNCVPEWMKPAPKDPFDYKLRSKEEILEEFKYYEEPFTIEA